MEAHVKGQPVTVSQGLQGQYVLSVSVQLECCVTACQSLLVQVPRLYEIQRMINCYYFCGRKLDV